MENQLSQISTSTAASVKSFFEKVIPTMVSIMKNSKYVAAQNALDFVQTDDESLKAEAKLWIKRCESFRDALNDFVDDKEMPQEIREKYYPID